MKLLTTLAARLRQERGKRRLSRIVEANRNSPACKDYVRHRDAQNGRAV